MTARTLPGSIVRDWIPVNLAAAKSRIGWLAAVAETSEDAAAFPGASCIGVTIEVETFAGCVSRTCCGRAVLREKIGDGETRPSETFPDGLPSSEVDFCPRPVLVLPSVALLVSENPFEAVSIDSLNVLGNCSEVCAATSTRVAAGGRVGISIMVTAITLIPKHLWGQTKIVQRRSIDVAFFL
jgi:hypothetical protein